MAPARRTRLNLETLEDRVVPAITIQSVSSNLYITGTPTAVGPALSFTVKETSANKFTITDGTKTLGTFSCSGLLSISLNNYNAPINVDVDGNTFGGNLLMNLGLGNSNPSVVNAVSVYSSVAGGAIQGNVTIENGSGSETENLGAFGPFPGTPAAITVGGSVTDVGRNVAGHFFNAGDTLFIGPGSTIRGNLNTSYIDSVGIGEPGLPLTTINGSASINDAGSPVFLEVSDFGAVGKDMTVTGTSSGDTFDFEQAAANTGGTIGGNLTLNLGSATNLGELVILATNTSVGGNASIQSQGGAVAPTNGSYSIAGSIAGYLNLGMGEGDNSLAFSGSVAANMTVTGGNGTNDLGGGTLGGSFTGTVAGSLSVTLGNGTNTAIISNAPGGLMSWTSGNGNDTLELEGAAGSAYNLNLLFGTGTNTLNLDTPGNTAITFSGIVRGQGGNNTLNQGSNGTYTNISFINFP